MPWLISLPSPHLVPVSTGAVGQRELLLQLSALLLVLAEGVPVLRLKGGQRQLQGSRRPLLLLPLLGLVVQLRSEARGLLVQLHQEAVVLHHPLGVLLVLGPQQGHFLFRRAPVVKAQSMLGYGNTLWFTELR